MPDSSIELTCIEQIDVGDDDFFFWGDGSEKFIFKNGVIHRKAYKHILSSKSFAIEYLSRILADQIDLDCQTQHLVILDRLDSLIKDKCWNFLDLAPLFREAMLALAKKSSLLLSEIQNPDEIRKAIQIGYDYYGFNGLTELAVARARRAAVQGMIRKFAEQYSAEGGYKGDLYGRYYFELANPKIAGVIPWLARDYHKENRLSTRISLRNDGKLSLQFFNLMPFNDINNLNLAVETYAAAIPVLEYALEMDAKIYWELID